MTSTHLQNGNPPSDTNLSQTSINQMKSVYLTNGDGIGGDPAASHLQMRARQNHTPTLLQMKRNSIDGCSDGANGGVASAVGHQRTVSFDGLDINGKVMMNGNGSGGGSDAKNNGNPFASGYATSHSTASGRTDVYSQITAVLKKHAGLRNSGSSNELNAYGPLATVGEDGVAHPRPQRPHSVAVSTAMLMGTLDERRQPMSLSTGTKLSHSTSLHQAMGVSEAATHIFKPIVTYGHYSSNSPSRMSGSRSTQEFSVYATPSNGPVGGPTIIPPVVQRRSQSTPRPVHSTMTVANGVNVVTNSMPPNGGIPQRPRSLDRNTLAASFGIKQTKPPPIPSRRFSQPPLSQATSTPQRMPPQTNGNGGGMRQSATFHGHMNRHAAPGTGGFNATPPEVGTRRKPDRPLSFAYGTVPDQDYLESQLKMYSEQLKTITETVRKYSEQAKLLSELKRQQAQQQIYQPKRSYDTLPRKLGGGSGEPACVITVPSTDTVVNVTSNVSEPPSAHQLKLFLDGHHRNNVHDPPPGHPPGHPPTITADRSRTLPRRGADSPGRGAPPKANGEPKTPSDQLRQFLDAIRSNQLPEEHADVLSHAANRFSKFKENLEKSRPKSMVDFDRSFESSNAISETFNQVSDNLRIMNQDLEALGRSPMKKLPPNSKQMPPTDLQISCNMDQILDRFTQLTHNAHALDTVDYLRKCSEALRHTSEQLRLNGIHSSFSDSNDSSSCSTTPGSIREAVQNLLQQPRNGVLIMDDRMKLFIDIMDSQSKFSQVKSQQIFLFFYSMR